MSVRTNIQLSTFIILGAIYSCHGQFTTAFICLGIAAVLLVGNYGYKLYKKFKE